MSKCQNVTTDGLTEPLQLKAFALRARGATWQDCADECGVSASAVRKWAKTEEWAQEVANLLADLRIQIKMQTAGAGTKAIEALVKLLDSRDENVKLKAASKILDWLHQSELGTPQTPNEPVQVSDAEAAKLISSAQSLPDLPAGAES